MAQPPAYNRQKNFADDFGNETDHSALNAELDRASNSINDVRKNLAILQADDGKLRPSVVTSDSISEELRIKLVEGVVVDAQTMLDKSLAAANVSFGAATAAKTSEIAARASASSAAESAKIIASVTNADWNATSGRAQVLNKPTTLSGYGITDALHIPEIDDSAHPLNISVAPNTIYTFGTVSALTITETANGLRESQIRFSTGDTVPVVTIPETLKHVGEWEIEPNGDYIISILDNIAVLGKVVA